MFSDYVLQGMHDLKRTVVDIRAKSIIKEAYQLEYRKFKDYRHCINTYQKMRQKLAEIVNYYSWNGPLSNMWAVFGASSYIVETLKILTQLQREKLQTDRNRHQKYIVPAKERHKWEKAEKKRKEKAHENLTTKKLFCYSFSLAADHSPQFGIIFAESLESARQLLLDVNKYSHKDTDAMKGLRLEVYELVLSKNEIIPIWNAGNACLIGKAKVQSEDRQQSTLRLAADSSTISIAAYSRYPALDRPLEYGIIIAKDPGQILHMRAFVDDKGGRRDRSEAVAIEDLGGDICFLDCSRNVIPFSDLFTEDGKRKVE